MMSNVDIVLLINIRAVREALPVVLFMILTVVCIVLMHTLFRIRRQLTDWLACLKEAGDMPERKIFVKGEGILAEINYELNAVLKENRKQFHKLKRAEDANKQLLTNLSHDVRTPLASLSGYLEALEQGNVKETEQKEYVHTAYRKTLELRELVDALFDLFKINSGEQRYEMADTDINELTRELIIGYMPIAAQHHIALNVYIPDEEYFIRIDRLVYARIVNNLFQNAVLHGNCTEITFTIRKKQEEQTADKTVVIEIGNDGTVLSKEQLPYLFDRLYQGDTSRSGQGNGLGLAIVNELTTAMQGKVEVTSTQENGTAFLLSFPMKK